MFRRRALWLGERDAPEGVFEKSRMVRKLGRVSDSAAVTPNIEVDFQHPANAGILAWLTRDYRGTPAEISRSPGRVRNPYYTLGTHPDLVEWVWDTLTSKLPRRCQWVLYGTPVLVHPRAGIVFAFCGGTHVYALRLPPGKQSGMKRERVWRYSSGHELDLDAIGPEWAFGDWNRGEADLALEAYEFAASGSTFRSA